MTSPYEVQPAYNPSYCPIDESTPKDPKDNVPTMTATTWESYIGSGRRRTKRCLIAGGIILTFLVAAAVMLGIFFGNAPKEFWND